MELDRIDRKILDILQTDCTRTHARIGKDVGLSGSAVRRRIQLLRKEKIIAREVAILGDLAKPIGISVIVSVTFEKETTEAYRSFRAAMKSDKRVLQCYATSGQFDFMLIVAAQSPQDYEEWGERVLLSNPDIRRYESYVVWSTVKFTTKRLLPND